MAVIFLGGGIYSDIREAFSGFALPKTAQSKITRPIFFKAGGYADHKRYSYDFWNYGACGARVRSTSQNYIGGCSA